MVLKIYFLNNLQSLILVIFLHFTQTGHLHAYGQYFIKLIILFLNPQRKKKNRVNKFSKLRDIHDIKILQGNSLFMTFLLSYNSVKQSIYI